MGREAPPGELPVRHGPWEEQRCIPAPVCFIGVHVVAAQRVPNFGPFDLHESVPGWSHEDPIGGGPPVLIGGSDERFHRKLHLSKRHQVRAARLQDAARADCEPVTHASRTLHGRNVVGSEEPKLHLILSSRRELLEVAEAMAAAEGLQGPLLIQLRERVLYYEILGNLLCLVKPSAFDQGVPVSSGEGIVPPRGAIERSSARPAHAWQVHEPWKAVLTSVVISLTGLLDTRVQPVSARMLNMQERYGSRLAFQSHGPATLRRDDAETDGV